MNTGHPRLFQGVPCGTPSLLALALRTMTVTGARATAHQADRWFEEQCFDDGRLEVGDTGFASEGQRSKATLPVTRSTRRQASSLRACFYRVKARAN